MSAPGASAGHPSLRFLSGDLPGTLRELVQVPPSQIPDAIGYLECVKASLWARLAETQVNSDEEDTYLTAPQVATKLQVDVKWVYSHADELGVVRLSRRNLRFPESAVERYLRRRKAASTRR